MGVNNKMVLSHNRLNPDIYNSSFLYIFILLLYFFYQIVIVYTHDL